MDIHVLNGDSLGEKFPFSGGIIICRECLIEGPVNETDLAEFWKQRAAYLAKTFAVDEQQYFTDVQAQIENLRNVNPADFINLWFEHDLFCQINMWFVLDFIRSQKLGNIIYRTMPPDSIEDVWSGFGKLTATDLQECFEKRVRFSASDIELASDLWSAYQQNDLDEIRRLSTTGSLCFKYLEEACDAHIQRFNSKPGRPQRKLKELRLRGLTDFSEIFNEFKRSEGIYGFGDLQVKKMLAEL
jgi:hypothetical protein